VLLLSEAISRRYCDRVIAQANSVRTAVWAKKNDFQKYINSLKDASKGYKMKLTETSLESLGFENRTGKK